MKEAFCLFPIEKYAITKDEKGGKIDLRRNQFLVKISFLAGFIV